MTLRRTLPDPLNLLLGTGELYLNGDFVGTLSGTVNFQYTRSYVDQRAGDVIAPIKSFLTSEEVMLTAELAEFRLENLRHAFGTPNSEVAGPHNIIRVEFLTMTATDAQTLGETSDVAVPIRVFNTTRTIEYTLTTDFTFAANAVTRVGSGAITDGQVVLVQYEVSIANASKLVLGGACDVPTFKLDFVHKECADTGAQITLFKAYSNTDFQMAFNARESGDFSVSNISFKGLVDASKLPGQNLFEIIKE